MRAMHKQIEPSILQLSGNCTLHPIPYWDISDIWQEIEPFIVKVLNKMEDTTPIENIKNDLLKRARQLWLIKSNGVIKAVGTTAIQDHGKQRTGILTYVSGEDIREWINAIDEIADYFKAMKCDKFSIIGRRGWKKIIERRGFKEKKTIFERGL